MTTDTRAKTHKVAELTGALLDAAVAKAGGQPFMIEQYLTNPPKPAACWLLDRQGKVDFTHGLFRPSKDWDHGGPIIERERITIVASKGYDCEDPLEWSARVGSFSHYIDERLPFEGWTTDAAIGSGPAPLIAAMRAYVGSKLGESVELP